MRTLKEIWHETRARHSCSPDSFSDQETLSFCDLPIYSSDADNSSGKEYQNSSSSSSSSSNSNTEDELFEFFTSRLDTSNDSQTQTIDGFIFCGKLIPNKQKIDIPSSETNNIQKHLSKSSSMKKQLLQWIPFPSSLPKTCSTRENAAAKSSQGVKRSSSSRWHLLGFEPLIFPQQHGIMEAAETKSRQCKEDVKQPSSRWYASNKGYKKRMLKSRSSSEKGLLRLVGCLACQDYYSYDATTAEVVETSTIPIPRARNSESCHGQQHGLI